MLTVRSPFIVLSLDMDGNIWCANRKGGKFFDKDAYVPDTHVI